MLTVVHTFLTPLRIMAHYLLIYRQVWHIIVTNLTLVHPVTPRTHHHTPYTPPSQGRLIGTLMSER